MISANLPAENVTQTEELDSVTDYQQNSVKDLLSPGALAAWVDEHKNERDRTEGDENQIDHVEEGHGIFLRLARTTSSYLSVCDPSCGHLHDHEEVDDHFQDVPRQRWTLVLA